MSQLMIETFHQQPDEITKLNKWIFEIIQPYVKGRTLEMDSGSGVFSSFFIDREMPIHLSDFEKANRDKLRERFNGSVAMRGVHRINYARPDFEQRYLPEVGVFSTILGLNISEHGLYQREEIDNAKRLLQRGGRLIVALPSYTAIYPGLELGFEELKTLNWKPIKKSLSGFKILRTRYFSRDESTLPNPIQSALSVIVVARKDY